MSNVLYITREQDIAIRRRMERFNESKEDILEQQITHENSGSLKLKYDEGTDSFGLNGMSITTLARALYEGYLVRETYEEGQWVTRLDTSKTIFKVVRMDGDMAICDRGISHSIYKLRYSTEEEIKFKLERDLWEELGREFREIKIGDKYTVCGNMNRTIEGIGGKRLLIEVIENGEPVTLYPVDSAVTINSNGADGKKDMGETPIT